MTLKIIHPVVSGIFYPANPDKLKKNIETLLSLVPESKEELTPLGLISPHAGYIYSGQTAAFGYKLLEKKKFDTVIVMGPSHTTFIMKSSVYPEGVYRTSLGDVEIDSEIADKLLQNKDIISFEEEAHLQEHSIEVQLPFLQIVLKNFKFVPIIIGNQNLDYADELSTAIFEIMKDCDKKFLVIASSDLSHYHSSDVAKRMDRYVAEAIKRFDYKTLAKKLADGTAEACGAGAILTLIKLMLSLGCKRCDILDVTNSGKTTNDYSRVVGYLSAAFY